MGRVWCRILDVLDTTQTEAIIVPNVSQIRMRMGSDGIETGGRCSSVHAPAKIPIPFQEEGTIATLPALADAMPSFGGCECKCNVSPN